jgi:F5/8 type C domain/LiaF transmembrane domain
MASTIELAERTKRQAVVSKVVWGLLFMTMGVLFMLENLGKIDLSEQWRYPAANAVDGDPATRWSSAFEDPQWITVDLGSTAEITRVRLNWEAAYATHYSIEVSDDEATWTTVKSVTKSTVGIDDHQVAASGRYVRMRGTQRATPYGYSLWEFEVYGPDGLLSRGKPAAVSSRESTGLFYLYWPVLMIGAGLPALLAPKDGGDQVVGLFLTGFGVLLQAQRLALVSLTLAQGWPIVVMAAGLLLVVQALRQMVKRSNPSDAGPGSAR